MKIVPKECSFSELVDTVKDLSEADKRFCFILGAGASDSSGIPVGSVLASKWLDDLKRNKPEAMDEWVKKNNVDKNNIGRFYSELYKMRFSLHPNEGPLWLQKIMSNCDVTPNLGYYHLANILANIKTINLVITTNFDSLVEDALFLYTDKKPLVASHEFLAEYINDVLAQPTIAKIHRDIMLGPKSKEDEICKLADQWEPILKKALSLYSPIVIGYGGNDGSLMGLLEKAVKENGKDRPIYWCYKQDDPPKNEKILALLIDSGGYLVPIKDFDWAMCLLGLKFGYNFYEESLKINLDKRIKKLKDKCDEIIGKQRHEEKERKLSDNEKAIIEASEVPNRKEIDSLNKKIEDAPKNARLYYSRGRRYYDLEDYVNALNDVNKAIEFEPNNANYYDASAYFLYLLKKYDDAISRSNTAIELSPNDANFYRMRGKVYKQKGDFNKSIQDYSKAIELYNKDCMFFHQRALCYVRLGLYNNAVNDFNEALKLKPVCLGIYNAYGDMFLNNSKEYDKAIKIFITAKEKEPNNAEIYYKLGRSHHYLKEYNQAIEYF